jgi:hypothetical protein
MNCNSTTITVATVVFNGQALTPLNKSAMIKLGGEVADTTNMDNAGRAFTSTKIEPGEIEFEIPLTRDFDEKQFRGQCGDLQFLTREGANYLITNAMCSSSIEIKDGEGKVKLSFRGDAAVSF